jgi:hypothetical protein
MNHHRKPPNCAGVVCRHMVLGSVDNREVVWRVARRLGPARFQSDGQTATVQLGSHSSRVTHVIGVNPTPRAVMVESQILLDPAAVRLDCPRGQSTHLAGSFVLIEELHTIQSAAQELLRQFAPRNLAHPPGRTEIDIPPPSGILNPFGSQKQSWVAPEHDE